MGASSCCTLCPMLGINLGDLVHYKGKRQRAENRIVKLLLIYPPDLQYRAEVRFSIFFSLFTIN
jgi:hypothetical protein